MLQQRFEDDCLTGAIASDGAADWLKAHANASPAVLAQQQHEDRKTTQEIEAEKRKAEKKQENQQGVKPKRKEKTTTRRGK